MGLEAQEIDSWLKARTGTHPVNWRSLLKAQYGPVAQTELLESDLFNFCSQTMCLQQSLRSTTLLWRFKDSMCLQGIDRKTFMTVLCTPLTKAGLAFQSQEIYIYFVDVRLGSPDPPLSRTASGM